MHVHKNWVLVGMLIPWFDLYQVKDLTVFCKPWRAFSVWEKIRKDGCGRAAGSLSLFQGSLCKGLVRQNIVGWDSWDTDLGSPVLSLGKPFMLQNSTPSSSKAMVGLPRLRQPVTQEARHTPGVTAEYTTRPPSAWQDAQHAFLLTRERRQIFVGTRLRNSGIYWNWARCWILKEKEKLQALDRCPWLEQLSYVYTCMSIYTHMCLCICACIYFVFHNL